MSNAAKHRKKAAEFEQLKQIDRAIASYIRAIEESEAEGEEVDVALLNKVGDLTLRQGRVPDAVTYYERAVEHYATAGLFNNAIALCNKILRNAPGRANVYFTLGRICAKKGLRGDATRNFLEYATRMQQDGRVDEGMRALAEVADLMPELTEVRRLVEEHAERAGIALPRRKTPAVAQAAQLDAPRSPGLEKSSDLIFLDIGLPAAARRNTPPLSPRVPTPARPMTPARGRATVGDRKAPARPTPESVGVSLDEFMLFDPRRPDDHPGRPLAPAVEPVANDVTGQAEQPAPIDQVESAPVELTPVELTPVELTPVELTPVELTPVEQVVIDEIESRPVESASSETAPALEMLVEAQSFVVLENPELKVGNDLPFIELDASPHVEHEIEAAGDTELVTPADDTVDELPMVAPVAGLEAAGDFTLNVTPLEGLTTDDSAETHGGQDATAESDATANNAAYDHDDARPSELTWVTPEDALEGLSVADGLQANVEFASPDQLATDELDTAPLSGLEVGEFEPSADVINAEPVIAFDDATELGVDAAATVDPVDGFEQDLAEIDIYATKSLTPLEVSPIPELDAAIEAGAMAAARADADPEVVLRRPPFRLDPHDFILPGELPPLLVDDALVRAGLGLGTPEEQDAVVGAVVVMDTATDDDDTEPVAPSVDAPDAVDEFEDPDAPLVTPAYSIAVEAVEAVETIEAVAPVEANDAIEIVEAVVETVDPTESAATEFEEHDSSDGVEDIADAEARLRAAIEEEVQATGEARRVSTTPALPIAAVAAEANAIAFARRNELREAVRRDPHDWVMRRRLAEALFEAGEREEGLSEMQVALTGFAQAGHLGAAADIADALVRISPSRIPYHQKRVELAVRLSDQQRLRAAYLDLGDSLVRMGDETRAHAVYARVLEIDPYDERARAALGAAAPPPPPPPTPDDEHVNLADWLREDAPVTTRMRMPEPTVSGDEQADFDALLQHFKEGVARSLGEEDFESHYDLGVAYKEMGLLDDAIAEFQKALRSRRHRLPAYEALGQCFVEQSRHSVAVTVLTRALHEPGLTDEQGVGVLYLLAYSCEALQRWEEARSYYSRVYATDINFRDVAARVAALDQLAR